MNTQKWYYRAWDGLKWFGWEVMLMFSNRASFFSSKRWERFAMFSTGMLIIICYVQKRWHVLTPNEIMAISGMLFTGGIINAVQIRRDLMQLDQKKKDKNENEDEPK